MNSFCRGGAHISRHEIPRETGGEIHRLCHTCDVIPVTTDPLQFVYTTNVAD